MKTAYHIKLSAKDISGAKTALLPGDPGRVEKIAKTSQGKKIWNLSFNREYKSALCEHLDKPILVVSTGIGCPSLAIAVEELAQLGVENFIRVGTTGAIQTRIKPGDMIITTAAVRLEGTSEHYAPLAFPAVASYEIVTALVEAAKKMKFSYHTGITVTSDTFYPGQERYDSFTGHVIREYRGSLSEWRKLGALNYEMESSALFVITSVFGLKSGTVCGVIVNRAKTEKPDDKIIQRVEMRLAKVAVEAASKLK
ncbi:uridine phosphorylase [candidate division WOR-3 bacterium]|nr:uridine phosphorylase [candidate division WOR-3 bacterium]